MTPRDIANHRAALQRQEKGGRSESEMLRDTLLDLCVADSGVAINTVKDTDGIVQVLFVQTTEMRENVRKYGVVVHLDHTYKIDKNAMPVAILMVRDGAGLGRVAGIAYVSNEEKVTVASILEAFKESIGEEVANNIWTFVIDKDYSEAGAINKIFPKAAIQLCLCWYDSNMVHSRWKIQKPSENKTASDTNRGMITSKTIPAKTVPKTSNQRFSMANVLCQKICNVLAACGKEQYALRYKVLQDLFHTWCEGEEVTVSVSSEGHVACNTGIRNNTQNHEESNIKGPPINQQIDCETFGTNTSTPIMVEIPLDEDQNSITLTGSATCNLQALKETIGNITLPPSVKHKGRRKAMTKTNDGRWQKGKGFKKSVTNRPRGVIRSLEEKREDAAQKRKIRAVNISDDDVKKVGNTWTIVSQTDRSTTYTVSKKSLLFSTCMCITGHCGQCLTCTCKDTNKPCKHVLKIVDYCQNNGTEQLKPMSVQETCSNPTLTNDGSQNSVLEE
ncbi:uncharacterized protein LOC127751895, partial [Frankliniella occidentalis]|uniref:Uncharacterized protein LOC127751895 n=1 Tax=Frankliniella occidentalis TaxID=133901 RepID=A0A9C6XA76_FRAOC